MVKDEDMKIRGGFIRRLLCRILGHNWFYSGRIFKEESYYQLRVDYGFWYNCKRCNIMKYEGR